MKNKLNIVLCFILALIFCFSAVSCDGGDFMPEVSGNGESSSAEASGEATEDLETSGEITEGDETSGEVTEIVNMDYSVVLKNGVPYLVFDDPSKYGVGQSSGGIIPGFIEFASAKAFKDAIAKGTLTEADKRLMARIFVKDDTGAVKLPDFNDFYEPTLPDGFVSSFIHYLWDGGYYYYINHPSTIGGRSLIVAYCGDEWTEEYDKEYKTWYTDLYTKEDIKIETSGNKEIIQQKYGQTESKYVRYTLVSGTKTMIVDKEYLISTASSLATPSSTVPYNITVYCTDGPIRFILKMDYLDEDVPDDIILQIGLKKFVG